MLRVRIEDGYLFAVWFNRWVWLIPITTPAESHTGCGKWEW